MQLTLSNKRLKLILTFGILIGGVVQCLTQFGSMFWGNWLHSTSFSVGFLAVISSIAAATGLLAERPWAGFGTFCVLLSVYAFFFWTFLGWQITHRVIYILFFGDVPPGM